MPTQTAASVAIAAKYGLAAKLLALLAAGGIGALLIAAVDPAEAMADPKQRRKLIFTQVLVALMVAGIFGPFVTSWLGKPSGWFPVDAGDMMAWIELAMPVGLCLGALSWGIIGAAVKLRALIAAQGATAIAKKVGMAGDDERSI